MTDNKTNATAGSKLPSHIAYHVIEREGKKAIWTRVGGVWGHSDGKGFNIELNGLVPLDGRITCRVASENKE
jgi:hypothetical protein